MDPYLCPLCGRSMPRELILFLDHTRSHIIDKIKEQNPEWVEADGACKPCTEYYEMQLSGEWRDSNIGPKEQRKRLALGMGMFFVGGAMILFFLLNPAPRLWRSALFIPVFLGALGLIQSRKKTCVLLAERCVSHPDSGEKKIKDPELAKHLKARGKDILFDALLWATLTTVLFILFP